MCMCSNVQVGLSTAALQRNQCLIINKINHWPYDSVEIFTVTGMGQSIIDCIIKMSNSKEGWEDRKL